MTFCHKSGEKKWRCFTMLNNILCFCDFLTRKDSVKMNGECLTLFNSMMLLRIFKQFFDWFLVVIWHGGCIHYGMSETTREARIVIKSMDELKEAKARGLGWRTIAGMINEAFRAGEITEVAANRLHFQNQF